MLRVATLVRVARDGSSAIFKVSDGYVHVDAHTHDARAERTIGALTAGGSWRVAIAGDADAMAPLSEIADAAVVSLDPTPVTAAAPPATSKRRVYRVPQSVRDEVLRALSWRNGLSRGGSSASEEIASRLATAQSVDIDFISRVARQFPRFSDRTREFGWMSNSEGYPSAERITWGLWGGDAGQRWSRRVVAQHRALTASGDFQYDDSCDYFGAGQDENTTDVNTLYVHYPEDDAWAVRQNGGWVPSDAPTEPLVIELDEESAKYLADALDTSPDEYVSLSSLNPEEAHLFALAANEIDWGLLDVVTAVVADAIGDGRYTPQERSQNAQRQGRSSDGKFGSGGGSALPQRKSAGISGPKGKLPSPLPVITDVQQHIADYLAQVEQERASRAQTNAAGDPPAAADPAAAPIPAAPADPTAAPAAGDTAGMPAVDVKPLYLAIVDQTDPQAVLDVVALVPPAEGTQGDVTCWRRAGGKWVAAPDVLADLRGVTPPPVVDISDDTLLNTVLQQVDAHDAQDAHDPASPVTSSAADFGVGEQLARPLWGPHGELISLVAAGTPGVADTPSDERAVERLKQYWLHGEGAAKIRWNTPGDWTRCNRHLQKYMGDRAKGYCQLLHKEATGTYTGSRENIGNQR